MIMMIYLFLFILLLFTSFIAIRDTIKVSKDYDHIIDTSIYKMSLIRENRLAAEQIQLFTIDVVFHPADLNDGNKEQTQKNIIKNESNFKEFSKSIETREEDSLFKNVRSAWQLYERSRKKFIELKGDEQKAINYYETEEKKAYNTFYGATNALSNSIYDTIKARDKKIDQFTLNSQIKISSFIGFVIAFLMILGFLVVKNVKKLNRQHKQLIEKDRNLQQSEQLYKNLFEKSPLPKWVCDRKTLQVYEVNDAATKLYGYTKDEFLKLTVFDIRPKEDHEKLRKFLKENDFTARNDGIRKHVKKNGETILVEIGLDNIWYKGKEAMLVVIHDVTEKKRSEEAIRTSEELYRSLFNDSPVFNWVCEAKTLQIFEVNEAAIKAYGYSKGEFLNMSAFDLLAKEELERIKHQIENPSGEFYRSYDKHVRKNGEIMFVDINVHVINYKGKKAGLVIGVDVTEKLKVEEKLKQEEDFYRNITENSSDVETITNKDGKITFASPSIFNIFGYTRDEVIGKTSKDFWHPLDFKTNKEKVLTLIEHPGHSIMIEIRCLDKNGIYRWCEARISNQLHNPSINGFISNYSDITERKFAEEKVKTSEELYHSLFDKNPLPIFVVSKKTMKYLEVNDTAIELYGYSKEEFLNMTVFDIRLREDHESLKEIMKDEKIDHFKNYNVRHVKKNGEKIIVDVTVENIFYKGEPAHLAIIRDITNTLQLQNQLNEEKINRQKEITRATIDGQEKERAELGKELHDNVNQILASAKLYLGSAGKADVNRKNELIEESKGLIDSGIQEIRKLSKSLVPPALNNSSLKESIEELIDPVRITTDKKIDTIFSLPDETILCDKLKITIYRMIQEQMNNILKYAEASRIRIVLKQDRYKLLLQIKDNGKGFDAKAKNKGIGLTNIANRAEVYNGKVIIDSAPGNGCCLSVFFPLENLHNSGDRIISMTPPGMAS